MSTHTSALAKTSATSALAQLSPEQRVAIEQLAGGASLAAAAEAARVHRGTVYRWLKSDADFAAVYHAWQSETVETARARLLALADAAVTTVATAITQGDARTALAVLKGQGLLTPPTPGSTDAQLIARQNRNQRAKAYEAVIVAEETCPVQSFIPDDLPNLAMADADLPKLIDDPPPHLPGQLR